MSKDEQGDISGRLVWRMGGNRGQVEGSRLSTEVWYKGVGEGMEDMTVKDVLKEG